MNRRQPSPLVRRLVLALAAIVILLAGYILGNQYARQRLEQQVSAQLLETPRALPAFSLTGTDGQAFGPEAFAGHWSFVYFGCIDCADSRENVLALFHRLFNRLADAPELQARMRLVFVATDPAADPPERLRERVFRYNPEFVGLSGESRQMAILAAALAGSLSLPETGGLNESPLYLVAPDGRQVATFTGLVDVETLGRDLRAISEHLRL
jgi:protein SCO1/2